MEKQKVCNYCQKEIPFEAIKCPYCQEWLNKKTLSWRNPYAPGIIMILLAIVSFGAMRYWHYKMTLSLFTEPITYNPKSELKILHSKAINDDTGLRVIGEIENKENFKWSRIELLTVFKDKNNETIFLAPVYIYDVRPGEKRYFQSNTPCSTENLRLKNYQSYELFIESASSK
jgi:ribosomal protein L40E